MLINQWTVKTRVVLLPVQVHRKLFCFVLSCIELRDNSYGWYFGRNVQRKTVEIDLRKNTPCSDEDTKQALSWPKTNPTKFFQMKRYM